MGQIGYSRGVSPTMRGTWDEFVQDLQKDYSNSKFPFGESRTIGLNVGGHLAYRFPQSPFSLFLGYHSLFFYTSGGIVPLTLSISSVSMVALTGSVGGEYCWGAPSEPWNFFGRLALNTSIVGGSVPTMFQGGRRINIPPDLRFGFEAEGGGRYNIPSTPLAIEASVAYTNINLLGKSYTEPNAKPTQTLHERHINDAPDPQKAEDKGRVFDALSFRLGGRIWF